MQPIKFLKGVIVILTAAILILAGMALGIKSEEDYLQAEASGETVKDIAVVNLDEGIMKDGQSIYYAKQLMEFPDASFNTVNLEMARGGINNGDYAGYIIIPAEFSGSIHSINTTPKRITLEYAVNPNLREDIAKEILTNIHDFEVRLNANVSYLYVQAILEEFHDVQDSSGVIMKNDLQDLDNLAAIQSQELMAELELSPLLRVDSGIEDVDLSKEYQANLELYLNLEETYQSFVDTGSEEFQKIKNQQEGVVDEVEQFSTHMSQIDFIHDSAGTPVHESGITALEQLVSDYEIDFTNQKNDIKEKLGWTNPAGNNPHIIPLMDLINGAVQEMADDYNANAAADRANQIDALETQLQKLEALLTVPTHASVVQEAITEIESVKTFLENSTDIPSSLPIDKPEAQKLRDGVTNIIADVDQVASADVAAMETIIDNQIIQVIEAEVKGESDAAIVKAGEMLIVVDEYVLELDAFDAYAYYDSNEVGTIMSEFYDNTYAMEEKINDTHADYMEYVFDIYDTAEENAENLQSDINEAYDGTILNVDQMLAAAKEKRTEISNQNIDLLSGFTAKLPYTRLGNLEYTQAYNFIVQPVGSADASVAKKVSIFIPNYERLKTIIIGLATTVGLAGLLIVSIRLKSGKVDSIDTI